ncbi:MAG: O-antigen ligase family protein [Terriglobales bacterium]
MNSSRPLQWAGAALGLVLALYFGYQYLRYFSNVSFLGGIVLLEVIIACLWKYDERFLPLLMIAFIWAGTHVPMQGAWTIARWVVLFAGASVGFLVWTRLPRHRFGSLHLIAFFCVCAAFVSATVSPFIRMASLKASSLLLLFLYCASGGRLAAFQREDRFFYGLLWGAEIVVYSTAICYFGMGLELWGNPNSLGGAMSVAVFPILLWGWLVADQPAAKLRRLVALLLCAYLIFFSVARASMISMVVVTLVLCLCLHQYKLLAKVVAIVLLLIGITGVLAPQALNQQLGNLKDVMLYKGHKEEGILGSRRSPWEKSIATIKEHPLFGTGYGTSATGEDPGLDFGKAASSAETAREHGSSYMTIAEWVGLLGVLPFVGLLAVTVSNLWKVCAWMNRTLEPRHYSIPLAMVVLAGLVHAAFEDWLFAVGYYVCVYFWFCAFLLADFVPDAVAAPAPGIVRSSYHPSPAGLDAIVPNR